MKTHQRLVVYVDVDDTLLRSAGTKTMPLPRVVEHAKDLADSGAQLYCWSAVGAEYARSAAHKLGIEQCFVSFLPKPNIAVDDQELSAWTHFAVVHPLNAVSKTVDDYWELIDAAQSTRP
jgi:hypothetical protein